MKAVGLNLCGCYFATVVVPAIQDVGQHVRYFFIAQLELINVVLVGQELINAPFFPPLLSVRFVVSDFLYLEHSKCRVSCLSEEKKTLGKMDGLANNKVIITERIIW